MRGERIEVRLGSYRVGSLNMCCFTGPVRDVSATKIFARRNNRSQYLVYQMTVHSDAENAMVLPLPVVLGGPEDAVRFISLEDYPEFFDHMSKLFESREMVFESAAGFGVSAAPKALEIHSVGAFEASWWADRIA